MTNYREILRLDGLGLNKSQIAASCGCSRTTVIQVLRQAQEHLITYEAAQNLSDRELSQKLHPAQSGKIVFKMPDYEYVHKELQRQGVTLKMLWLEYCEECRNSGEIPYQSTQFNKYYNDYVTKTNATMHINHKPGEIMQVDWNGKTAEVIDITTGEKLPAYIFVAVLPFSGYAYVEASFSMNQECWIEAHVNAFKYFGGVPRILQCDNLKTGVIKHGKSEVVLNKSYNEMAEYYGTAILPCRVRAPKDKAMVEGTVGVVTNFIFGALRNRRFLSLSELNQAILDRLESFNNNPFQKREGSRASEFEYEKPFLRPLPKRPFELAEWRVATVAPNYHISIDRMNYSVPYEYIKQKVDVRLTKSTVEIFFDNNRICSHPRLYGRANQYSTIESHMPANHQKYLQWNGDRFVKWAAKIGIHTKTVIKALLDGYKIEQQGYKACMGILKLADKYSAERLESACRKALTFTPRPSLKNIKAILSSGQDLIDIEAEPTKENSSQYGFTRGDDYYKGRID
ncbi:MAG: IS21 family transposase [Ruminococcus sp.]|nr:IS21 family transposase [Ruminococcus sp.]